VLPVLRRGHDPALGRRPRQGPRRLALRVLPARVQRALQGPDRPRL
ncbi:MAG: hypothetical protein AVDCRST_MAG16-536, partial [uncultured Frankineae bacterium]